MSSSIFFTTLFFGVVHLLVDAASVSFYFTLLRSEAFADPMNVFFLYGLSAFAMQTPLGILSDRLKKPALTAAIGCVLVAVGPFAIASPLIALGILGTGNALYHVGGGAICLGLSRGRADLPGIFVAPGTFGVAVGTLLGVAKIQPTFVFAVLLVVAALFVGLLGKSLFGSFGKNDLINSTVKPSPVFLAAIALLCVTVALRSMVCDLATETIRNSISWTFAIPTAIFVGKFLGGFLADRFGWLRFTVGAILLAGPLILCSSIFPATAIPVLFLFGMSMPVTLAAISNLLPNRPGFAFGLASLALVLGSFVVVEISRGGFDLFVLVCATALLLGCGLLLYTVLAIKNGRSDFCTQRSGVQKSRVNEV